MKSLAFLSILCLLLAACSKPTTETVEGSLAPAEEAAKAPERFNICLWNELGVRETPSDKGKYLTSIYLGERLVMTGDSATETSGSNTRLFYKVTLSDGKSGWVRSDFMAKGVMPAAVAAETNPYKRPDMAAVTDVTLAPVEYVAAWPLGNGWAKVKTKRAGDKWFVEGYVQERSLLYDKAESDFAVLAKRAAETDKEAIRAALETQLADGSFADTKMYQLYYGVDEGGEGEYSESEADRPINPLSDIEDLASVDDANGNIINIYGVGEYWYVWKGVRYRLQETSAEVIMSQGYIFHHCTEDQLNNFPIGEKVLDYIPDTNTAVE